MRLEGNAGLWDWPAIGRWQAERRSHNPNLPLGLCCDVYEDSLRIGIRWRCAP